ncbi:MAG: hypothetical protein ABIW50_05895 [Candidatus Limnocylindria bacterium]
MAEIRFSPALIGAACNLSEADLRARVAEWAALKRGASNMTLIDDGVSVELGPDQLAADVADLAAREADCCPFYAFTLAIDGASRRLSITAGQGGQPAVRALLGMFQ